MSKLITGPVAMSAFGGKRTLAEHPEMSAYDPKRNMTPRACSLLRRISPIGTAVRKAVARKGVAHKEVVHTVVLLPATAVVLWAWACVRGQQWVVAEETLGQLSQGFAG